MSIVTYTIKTVKIIPEEHSQPGIAEHMGRFMNVTRAWREPLAFGACRYSKAPEAALETSRK